MPCALDLCLTLMDFNQTSDKKFNQISVLQDYLPVLVRFDGLGQRVAQRFNQSTVNKCL